LTTNYSWIYKTINPDDEVKMLLQRAAEYKRDADNAKLAAEEAQIQADICQLAFEEAEMTAAEVINSKRIQTIRTAKEEILKAF